MAGANYMGGKRNAAKARSKDTTVRAQKDFFSRQRLHILSKCLIANSRGPGVPLGKRILEGGLANIKLAHAKHNLRDVEAHRHPLIPSTAAVDVSPYTPWSEPKEIKSLARQESSSTPIGDKSGCSKVLNALDTSDPLFLRAAMDRILKMPDLAGLSKWRSGQGVIPRYTPRFIKRRTLSDFDPSARDTQGQNPKTVSWGSDPSGSGGSGCHIKHSNVNDADNRVSQLTRCSTSISDYIQQHSSETSATTNLLKFGTVCASPTAQSYEKTQSMDNNTMYKYDGYSDFEAGLKDRHDGLIQPSQGVDDDMSLCQLGCNPRLSQSSPSTLDLWEPESPEPRFIRPRDMHSNNVQVFSDYKLLSPISLHQTPALAQSNAGPNLLASPDGGLSRSPCSSRLSGQSKVNLDRHPSTFRTESVSALDEENCSTLPKNLFDHEDPWNAIGVILGLPSMLPVAPTVANTSSPSQTFEPSAMSDQKLVNHELELPISKVVYTHRDTAETSKIPRIKFDRLPEEGLHIYALNDSLVVQPDRDALQRDSAVQSGRCGIQMKTGSTSDSELKNDQIVCSYVKNEQLNTEVVDGRNLQPAVQSPNLGHTPRKAHGLNEGYCQDTEKCDNAQRLRESLLPTIVCLAQAAVEVEEPKSPSHLAKRQGFVFEGPCLFSDGPEESEDGDSNEDEM